MAQIAGHTRPTRDRTQRHSDDNGRAGDKKRDSVSKRYRQPLTRRAYAAALSRLERWLGLKLLLVYRRPLGPSSRGLPDALDQYRFSEIGTRELLVHAKDPSLKLTPQFVTAARQRGDVCVGALLGSRLVAYRWYAVSGTAPCDEVLYIRNAAPRQTYGYKMFTHPDHRGHRLQAYTMLYGDARMAERGFTHAMLYVATHNFASRRGLARVRNQKLVGIVGCVRVLGHYLVLRNPGLARYGFNIEPITGDTDPGLHEAQSWK